MCTVSVVRLFGELRCIALGCVIRVIFVLTYKSVSIRIIRCYLANATYLHLLVDVGCVCEEV